MVREPSKVLCCMFLLTILGVDIAQNLTKYKKVVICAHTTNHYSSIANETNDVRGQGPSNKNFSPFVCILIFADCSRYNYKSALPNIRTRSVTQTLSFGVHRTDHASKLKMLPPIA